MLLNTAWSILTVPFFLQIKLFLLLIAHPVYHGLDRASVDLTKASELVLKVMRHAVPEPVNDLTEQQALKEVDQDLIVLR